jgi:hypothetical protein
VRTDSAAVLDEADGAPFVGTIVVNIEPALKLIDEDS